MAAGPSAAAASAAVATAAAAAAAGRMPGPGPGLEPPAAAGAVPSAVPDREATAMLVMDQFMGDEELQGLLAQAPEVQQATGEANLLPEVRLGCKACKQQLPLGICTRLCAGLGAGALVLMACLRAGA